MSDYIIYRDGVEIEQFGFSPLDALLACCADGTNFFEETTGLGSAWGYAVTNKDSGKTTYFKIVFEE